MEQQGAGQEVERQFCLFCGTVVVGNWRCTQSLSSKVGTSFGIYGTVQQVALKNYGAKLIEFRSSYLTEN